MPESFRIYGSDKNFNTHTPMYVTVNKTLSKSLKLVCKRRYQ